MRTVFLDAVATSREHGRGHSFGRARRWPLSSRRGRSGAGRRRPRFYARLAGSRGGDRSLRGDDGLVPTPTRPVVISAGHSTPPLDLDALLTIEFQPNRLL